MEWFGRKWRTVILHAAGVTIVAHTFAQGTVGVRVQSGFDPGLASGKWAIRFLLLCLAVSPANTYLRWRWAIPLRKWLGLWAFAFAVLHLAVYLYAGLIANAQLQSLLRQAVTQFYMLLGLVGLLILSVLALTSNQLSMRMLNRNWKRLHRLVYGAAILVVVHALLATAMSKKVLIRDPNAVGQLKAYLILLVLLLALRLPGVKRALKKPAQWLRRGLAGEGASV